MSRKNTMKIQNLSFSKKVVSSGVLVALLSGSIALCDDTPPAQLTLSPAIAPFFQPPSQYADDFGSFRSPLLFQDGRSVKTVDDWKKRREEIINTWHGFMGRWPQVIEKPEFKVTAAARRGVVTQKRVSVEVVPGEMQEGFLLVPDGPGPFPAILIVSDLSPLISIGLADNPHYDGDINPRYILYDYGLQFAKRGFVTLAIGDPRHNLEGVQPLSSKAYVAANCCNALGNLPEVDASRIGIFGHSFGAKWALFASCLYDKFACAVWDDGGAVFDEGRGNVNYWEPWYLGSEPGVTRKTGIVTAENPRTGAYAKLVESGHDLHELHALMAPRPFLVSGGAEDKAARWSALNHAVAVNRFLGFENRVALTNRERHEPTEESNERVALFFDHFLKKK
jgi:hypothetical protein